jgi:hypothetical protein
VAPLPSTVYVGPFELDVLTGDAALAKLRANDDGHELAVAAVDPGEGWLAISDALSAPAKAVHLAHELAHALLFHGGHGLNDKAEEAVCKVLGPRLVQLVRDNPAVVAYLRRPGR